MATIMKKVDAVIVGFGWTGAIMAKELDIPLFSTPHTLFQACGILYAQGLAPCPPLAGKSLEE